MIYIKILFALISGVFLPYLIDYKKNHVTDDSYFIKNWKVLVRKIICDCIFAIISYCIIYQTKLPAIINWTSIIFIGANGCSLIEQTLSSHIITNETIN